MLICILGRQPKLGLAELESMIGSSLIKPLGSGYALVDTKPEVFLNQEFGGVIKVGEVISSVPSVNWTKLFYASQNIITRDLENSPGNKLTFGLSAYDLNTRAQQLSALSFAIKKNLKTKGRSVRVVLGNDQALNSAQVLYNGLNGRSGSEYLLVSNSQDTYISKTIYVQDIDSYSRRDFSRPKRDARVGMLPPKLAQIMLNLAEAGTGTKVLDPFCGTGVVLMEAALKKCYIEGSDINPVMIDYTKINLDWLAKEYSLDLDPPRLLSADATQHKWAPPLDRIVTETFLGRPLLNIPDQPTMETILHDCETIIHKFLINLRPQLSPESRCCIAVPAWSTRKGYIHLPVVDDLKNLGYNRVRFSLASFDDLIYHRSDQIVARELLVLTTR